jgi:hypothetical protein
MASAKDLAGIAALAGLGYYLVNRNKKKDEDGSTSVSSAATKAAAKAASDEDGRKPTDAENAEIDAAEKFVNPDLPRTEAKAKLPSRPDQKTSGVRATTPSGGPGRSPSGPIKTPMKMPTRPGQERYGSAGGRGPAAGEVDAYRQQQYEAAKAAAATPEGQAARKKQAESEAIEPVYPEQMIGMPGIKAVAGAAKALANRGMGQGLRTISQEALPYSGVKQIANNPTRQITGPSKANLLARDRAARATAREEGMAAENAQRYGLDPKAPGYESAAGAVRKNLGEDNFSLGMKRGGRVKAFASGGSVSSASSRGDGIASRGKTRGKMY